LAFSISGGLLVNRLLVNSLGLTIRRVFNFRYISLVAEKRNIHQAAAIQDCDASGLPGCAAAAGPLHAPHAFPSKFPTFVSLALISY
jgi:hypothetical protein